MKTGKYPTKCIFKWKPISLLVDTTSRKELPECGLGADIS
jgi:hypothetical protein